MYAAPFEYLAPDTLDEVLGLLQQHGEEATILAGGQTLVPMMSLRLATPELLIDLRRLPRGKVRVEGDHLVIPGSTRHTEVLRDPVIAEHAPMMQVAAAHIGNVRVRNRGTVGGSLAHADPAAEWPCVISALGGIIRLTSVAGTRNLTAEEFFDSYMTTTREPNELLTEVRIPLDARRGQAFLEMTRRANDFAVVEVAATAVTDDGGRLVDVTLAAGGVGERPMVLNADEVAAMRGSAPDGPAVSEAIEGFVARLNPSDGVHGSAGFRRHLARNLASRGIAMAASA